MHVKFEVLTAVAMKNTIVWDVAPCSLAEVYKISEERNASIFRRCEDVTWIRLARDKTGGEPL
jgi:hypothetical protein